MSAHRTRAWVPREADTEVARTGECRVDGRDAHLDEVRDEAVGRPYLAGTSVGDRGGTSDPTRN
jgi:hypothetical protein